MNEISLLILSKIPPGWRFYACDASILGLDSITLKRDESGEVWWHLLSEEEKEYTDLYAHGSGSNIDAAIQEAVNGIAKDINEAKNES